MSNNNNLAGSGNQPHQHSKNKGFSLHFFQRTGGEQPTVIDAARINQYFKGNYAKSWAMKDGFIPTFKEFKDGEIIFDMITDPRFTGNNILLSKWIARQYKSKVDVLKNATSFLAIHFKAQEPIGFLVSASTSREEIQRLNEKCKQAIMSLSTKPDFLHYGQLK